jgi:medium-chain acyl-[acyl-carrier-protein] hydrolase
MEWAYQRDDARRSRQGTFDHVAKSPISAPPIFAHLYCLPHAGGAARVFHPWRTLLRTDIDICALEYPGHGSRLGEPLLVTIEQMAHSIADQLMPEPRAPYALVGHSMGSLVAFETCRVLAARGVAMPSLLIACGHRGPRVPRSSPPIHDASHEAFIAHLRELGATPPELFSTPDLLELMLPILRTDFRACETYSPQTRPPLSVPMALYGGLSDEDTSRETLLAWRDETSGPCTVRMFPGGHFFIRDCADHVVATLERDIIGALATDR